MTYVLERGAGPEIWNESPRRKGTVAWARAEIDTDRLRCHAGIAFTEDGPERLASLLSDLED